MMISPAGANDPYAAATALDRQLRSPSGDAGASSDGAADASPDVVVTFSQGASAPATYDASGRLPGAPTLDDLGANRPDSLARATEAVGGAAESDAPSGSEQAPLATPEFADAPA